MKDSWFTEQYESIDNYITEQKNQMLKQIKEKKPNIVASLGEVQNNEDLLPVDFQVNLLINNSGIKFNHKSSIK